MRHIISQRLVDIFNDTLAKCPDVPEAILLPVNFSESEPKPGHCNITMMQTDTFTAGAKGDIVMNFASGWTPGGGVTKGCTAQEENLCQRSSLYRSLTSAEAKPFYELNHEVPNIGSDVMLLSKDVQVIKDANFGMLDSPYSTDVLTVAAPRLTDGLPCSVPELNKTLERRIYAIVKNLAKLGYRRPVLGAWGCGAYRNDPVVVARLFAKALNDYAGYFDEVIFAIPIGRNSRNYDVFARELTSL